MKNIAKIINKGLNLLLLVLAFCIGTPSKIFTDTSNSTKTNDKK